jgi:hypothetical protein
VFEQAAHGFGDAGDLFLHETQPAFQIRRHVRPRQQHLT